MGHLVVSTQQKNTQIMLLKKTCHVMSKSDRQMQRLKVLEAIVAIICQYKLFDSNGWNTLLVALWLSISYQTPNHWIDIIDKDFFCVKASHQCLFSEPQKVSSKSSSKAAPKFRPHWTRLRHIARYSWVSWQQIMGLFANCMLTSKNLDVMDFS